MLRPGGTTSRVDTIAGGFALADGPLPLGDIIAGIVAVCALISMAEEEEIHITTIPLEQYEKYLEHILYNSPKSYVEKETLNIQNM